MTEPPTPPTTPAIEALEAAGVPFRVVRTSIARDAAESAAFQGIELGALLRSILVRRATDDYVFVLVPGGRRFDWPKLRAHLGTNRLSLPDAEEARSITGYERGAITPFGALRAWPVIADASINERALVAIGGGARGVNVHLAPADLVKVTGAEVVDISVPEASRRIARHAGRGLGSGTRAVGREALAGVVAEQGGGGTDDREQRDECRDREIANRGASMGHSFQWLRAGVPGDAQ